MSAADNSAPESLYIAMVFRFLLFLGLAVVPVILIVSLIRSCKKKDTKKIIIKIVGLAVCVLLIYLALFPQVVPARVDLASVHTNKDRLFALQNGTYNFDTGYIKGELYISNRSDFSDYDITQNMKKKHVIDDTTTCSLSSVFCAKGGYVLCYPTISEGEMLVQNEKKTAYINYYYFGSNPADFMWFLTSPEVFYRQKISFDDILSTAQRDAQEETE